MLGRELGPWRVELAVAAAALFLGATGVVGAVHLCRRDGRRVATGAVRRGAPVLGSEALRGADLLVSVAGTGDRAGAGPA